MDFLTDFINVFDSIIVISSYVLLVLELRIAIVGLLRVMRLIKVVSGMKRVVDDKRAREEAIKQQKKQSATISTYVERVIEFLEKQTQDIKVPKHLQEDLQWVIDQISANKLYAGNIDSMKLDQDRQEVKAWMDMIGLKNIPVNTKELKRLEKLKNSEQDMKKS